MPGSPQTAWGVWGAPEPIKAWEHGAPKLHSEIGGSVKPGFGETLEWFYGRALNPKDKEHCLRLLAQIRLKQEDEKNSSNLAVRGRSLKVPSPPRPYSAKVQTRFRENYQKKIVDRPKSAIPNSIEVNSKTSYQKQKESADRLSRPKSAKVIPRKQDNRPKSAMATFGARRNYKNPYMTTHERDFPGYSSGFYAEATRPMTSRGLTASYELSGPIGETTNENEFGWKKTSKVEPIRSGTSSGNRRNNPHPHESFMVWKLPKESVNGMITATAPLLQYRDLTADVLSEITSDQLKSTYQMDYLGIPQGYQMKDAIDAPPDWKTRINYPVATTVRRTYKQPIQTKELVGNTSRYGCNKAKGVSALGVVPTVTASHIRNREVIKGKTTYDEQFRNRYDQPDLELLLDNQPNKKAYEHFLKYVKENQVDLKSENPNFEPKWVTKWEGPHHHEHQ